ncbi:hypothetical protein SAMN05414137_120101 [Streptacidiphilus jiangxiensis]|uniref:Uncharacterized protein n=1 Tax=Streptacidiphilus jiangxiensis TaxID=235985 RepID=A0A1H7WFV9_STRJI|nr:hypothetical protein SAMN05414137_120101 [Streptacidiphilus jiangxiensis]
MGERMKLLFTLTHDGPQDWTLALYREDTDELLFALTGFAARRRHDTPHRACARPCTSRPLSTQRPRPPRSRA